MARKAPTGEVTFELKSKVRYHIAYLLRMTDESPQQVPMSEELRAFVDEPTAQKIYHEWLADHKSQ